MKIFLYHVHNKICNHSTNEVDEVVDYALKNKYQAIYFCEHCPLVNTHSDHFKHTRPKYKQFLAYQKQIKALKKQYQNKIKLYFGYETECSQESKTYYEKLARDPICEFMICGNHFYNNVLKQQPLVYTAYHTASKQQVKQYWKNLKAAIESKLYSWIAHPEIFLNSYQKWDEVSSAICKKIIAYAIKYHLPLGFNINYSSPKNEWHYPVEKFWKMVANTTAKVIIENDSHDLSTIKKPWIEKNYALAYKWGLKKNLILTPKIKLFDKQPKIIFIQKDLYHLLNPALKVELNQNHCQIISYQNKNIDYLKKTLNQMNIHQVWSIIVSNNQDLCNKLTKQTSCFVIGQKGYDLTLKIFSQLKNWKQLITYFRQIKEQI